MGATTAAAVADTSVAAVASTSTVPGCRSAGRHRRHTERRSRRDRNNCSTN
jgi:hypothetical protein